jgi:hypothetical protein
MGEFELARRVVLRTMRTRAWREDIRAEDETMVAHIPQLLRINRLGMITENSQAGRSHHYTSQATGRREHSAERAYCFGFVHPDVADAFINWMWLNTDKYVVRAKIVEEWPGPVGRIGVTTERSKMVTWVSPFGDPGCRACNYGRWIYPEQGGAASSGTTSREEAMLAKARRAIGPYLAHPVPETAEFLLLVDMKWGRRANGRRGLFTEIEHGLRATARSGSLNAGK